MAPKAIRESRGTVDPDDGNRLGWFQLYLQHNRTYYGNLMTATKDSDDKDLSLNYSSYAVIFYDILCDSGVNNLTRLVQYPNLDMYLLKGNYSEVSLPSINRKIRSTINIDRNNYNFRLVRIIDEYGDVWVIRSCAYRSIERESSGDGVIDFRPTTNPHIFNIITRDRGLYHPAEIRSRVDDGGYETYKVYAHAPDFDQDLTLEQHTSSVMITPNRTLLVSVAHEPPKDSSAEMARTLTTTVTPILVLIMTLTTTRRLTTTVTPTLALIMTLTITLVMTLTLTMILTLTMMPIAVVYRRLME